MMTTTKFTNNVVRAKAVKLLTPKRAGNGELNKPGSKFTNEVHLEKPASHTNTGQSSGGGKSHTIGGKGGNSYGGHRSHDNQVIKAANY